MRTRVFAAAVAFLSASLLFSVQPHLGRRLSPTVGGGPAVWNACLVFFQTALLAGYGCAFQLITRIPRRAIAVHGIALLVGGVWLYGFALKPMHVFDSSPTLKILSLLLATVGLPIVALSATAPLAHHWSSEYDPGGDHYGVYAASNAGSLLALLTYPVLIEPTIGLDGQWTIWRWGFLTLAAAMNVLAWKGLTNPLIANDSRLRSADREWDGVATSRTRGSWLFWSVLPSTLLVSATQRITEDVAGGPLLWAPPLVCFLAASILAFSRRSPSLGVFAWMLPTLLLIRGTVLAAIDVVPTLWIQLAVELAVLFVAAWCSFAVLYSQRPPDADASSFYVWLALGGALGGFFAALAAPPLFRSTAEHPLTLLVVCLFLPISTDRSRLPQVLTLIGAALLLAFSRSRGGEAAAIEWMLLLGSVGMLMAVGMRRSLAFGLSVGAPIALLAQWSGEAGRSNVVVAERSEFGVHRVVEFRDDQGAVYHALRHGGVVHGWQCREEGRAHEPVGYYHPQSAVGEALAWIKRTSPAGDVAVVGLGAGAALAHRRSDQRFVFFEIDPTVVRIASDRRNFTYLSDAGDGATVRVGDGRLLLEETPDASFEAIFLDAFGGDAVPTHLLTREAFALYARKLRPTGVVVVNITNWYVDLEATVVAVGEAVGLTGIGRRQHSDRNDVRPGMSPTRCVVLARSAQRLNDLGSLPGWRRLKPTPGVSVWTDDFCDFWSVVRWKRSTD